MRTVWNNLTTPLTARVFRIHPIIVDKDVSVCGRVELYGCQPSEGTHMKAASVGPTSCTKMFLVLAVLNSSL